MEQSNLEERKEKPTLWQKLRFILIIIGVLALGFVALNQGMGFFYKIQFLKSPCQLCAELNPPVQECIDRLNEARPSYWTPDGWTDPFNNSVVKINISGDWQIPLT